MTLEDLFEVAKRGEDTSMFVDVVMKDVYAPGNVPYAGTVTFRTDHSGRASFAGATREEYGKTAPSRLAVQIISLAAPGAPDPDPAYLAVILPSPPFVPPNETFGAESFVPNMITPSGTSGVAFNNKEGTIQVVLHK